MASPTPYSEPLKPASYLHLPSIKQLVSKGKVVPLEPENLNINALQPNSDGLKDISSVEKGTHSDVPPTTEEAKVPVHVSTSKEEHADATPAKQPESVPEKEALISKAAQLHEGVLQQTSESGAEERSHDAGVDELLASGSNSGGRKVVVAEKVGGPAEASEDSKQIVSVPRISPEEWLHLFQTTGLCQAYDLESDRPTPAGTPLFVVQRSLPDSQRRNPFASSNRPATRGGDVSRGAGSPDHISGHHMLPDKPAFIVDDQTRTVVEETYTERHKYLVEMGFSAADISGSVPYVNASIKAEKKERQAAEQAVKRVFVTTREEFPRCRIDIGASLHSEYLVINKSFIDEVQQVTCKDINQYERRRQKVLRLRQAIFDLWDEKPLSKLRRKYSDLVSLYSLNAGGTIATDEESRTANINIEEAKRLKELLLQSRRESVEEELTLNRPEVKVDEAEQEELQRLWDALSMEEKLGRIRKDQQKREQRELALVEKKRRLSAEMSVEDKLTRAREEKKMKEARAQEQRRIEEKLRHAEEERKHQWEGLSLQEKLAKGKDGGEKAVAQNNRTDSEDEEGLPALKAFAKVIETALKRETATLGPERERIVTSMQDIIKRYGAVWIESITLGAQHMSTSERKETWDSREKETATKVTAGLAAAHAGAKVGAQATQESSKKESSEDKEMSNTHSSNATGGDTIAFHENADGKKHGWLESIRTAANWRIISYRSLRLLSELPGLDFPTEETGYDGETVVTFRRLLKERLQAVANDVRDSEAKKDPPRRSLHSVLKLGIVGYWYGFDCSDQGGGSSSGPSILQVKINKRLDFTVSFKGKGVAKGFRFHGMGEDKVDGDFCGNGAFFLEGYVIEVDGAQLSKSPYRPLGLVKMVKRDITTGVAFNYFGHVDWTGMHGVWRACERKAGTEGEPQSGSWSLAPVKFLPWDTVDEPWTFREREAHINEPRRRWLLPSDETLAKLEKTSASVHSSKRLDPTLAEGLWQGYYLRAHPTDVDLQHFLFKVGKYSISDVFKRLGKDGPSPKEGGPGPYQAHPLEWKRVQAPAFLELEIKTCALVGGQFGWQRFEVGGWAREGEKRYTVQGFIQQVPSRHSKRNLHDYPYLGKVGLTLTRSGLPGTSVVRKYYEGHLDHLGMHGSVSKTPPGSDRGKVEATFALMPVSLEVKAKKKLAFLCFGR